MTKDEIYDFETIPMTRGQLDRLMVRIYKAEGWPHADAEAHARAVVEAMFRQNQVDRFEAAFGNREEERA